MNTIRFIANAVIANLDNTINYGFICGKMGICIFLYNYSRLTKINIYEDLAEKMVGEILNNIPSIKQSDINDGLPGIGIGFIYLLNKGFVEEADDGNILQEIDTKLLTHMKSSGTSSHIFLDIMIYFATRFSMYKNGMKLSYIKQIKKLWDYYLQMSNESFSIRRDNKIEELKHHITRVLNHPLKSLSQKESLGNIVETKRYEKVIDAESLFSDLAWYYFISNNVISLDMSQKIFSRFISRKCRDSFYNIRRINNQLAAIALLLMEKKIEFKHSSSF